MATENDFDGLAELLGRVDDDAVIDRDGNPNRVIDDQFAFDVKIKWSVRPPSTAKVLDGQWTVKLYAESVGPGPEKQIGTTTRPATGVAAYKATITVPAGTLPSDVPPDSGVYKLVIVITYRNTLGQLTEMAAFAEGPMVLLRRP